MSNHSMSNVDRRDFLKTATVTGVGSVVPLFGDAVPAVAAPDKGGSAIDFGFSLYGMRSMKTGEALKACAEIGYNSVELVATAGWPCDPSKLSSEDRVEIRKQLSHLGLALPCLMENLHVVVANEQHQKNLDRLKAASELGHALSPDRPPVIETILGGRPAQWEEIKNKMVEGLGDWAKVAEAHKTVLAVKAHVGGALHTPEGAKWLVEKVASPWVKLTYDYSHFQLRDFELDESLKTMIDESVFIHVKDTKGKAGKFRFLLPGDGDIDYVSYFQQLKAGHYRGSVVVEVSGQIHGKPGYDPVEAARHSYRNLAPAFQKAGLRRST